MKQPHLIERMVHYFNLEAELDNPDIIHEEIVKGVVFKGTNLWILVFAIIVASVGLNMNSTAVIIGAMLISPLMGPINGMGYSIATYNSDLFKLSFRNFTFAVIASLAASTTYFFLSPISTAHSELLARTSPSIYDVLIALFGGLAGIVAISTKQKGNVIPGVAIATALMPPLCTAGYGLATAQFDFFFGALYLFTINSVFIALASVAISQLLKFPIRGSIAPAQKKKINQGISAVIMVVLIPSIYFGYGLVQKEKFVENANKYVSSIRTYEGNYLLRSDVNAKSKSIDLVFGGLNLSDEQQRSIANLAYNFDLDSARIQIRQGLSLDVISDEKDEKTKMREELSSLSNALKNKELQIDSIHHIGYMGKTLLDEIRNLYPQISGCTYAETLNFKDTISKPVKTPLVIFQMNKNSLSRADKVKISNWLQTRLNLSEVKVVYE
jgi:uncharacterized hydrophobic protein (TIGR00271 family)